jgi:hypothetical protein
MLCDTSPFVLFRVLQLPTIMVKVVTPSSELIISNLCYIISYEFSARFLRPWKHFYRS